MPTPRKKKAGSGSICWVLLIRCHLCAQKKGIARLLILLILSTSLLTLIRSSHMISKYYYSRPLVANDSTSISAKTTSETHQVISSESLPIYLIDTSNINHTNIAASTWGDIAPHWNRTAQFSNLLSHATTVSSLPNKYNNNANSKKRRQIILIHCGPKLGSTTLRQACTKNLYRTCPQINYTTYTNFAERHEWGPAGYFGGNRLISVMNKCVDTNYFCVKQMTMLPPTTTTTTTDESNNIATTAAMTQNVEYIHLFPFRNYNDWVRSAIKQQYDRGGEIRCRRVMELWDGGKCQHDRNEIDIRKYSRVDLDRFQDGVVRRMNQLGERGKEEHTFLLYLHRDLQRVMELVSTTYQMPMFPGTGEKLKGTRPEGTCNESLVEQYHECFSDDLMEFRWDLPENQLWKPDGAFLMMSPKSSNQQGDKG
eukprot:scaffold8938_cov213-Skeletonema_marinoi.AAC.6